MISRIKSKLFKADPSYSISDLVKEISELAQNYKVIAVCPQPTGPNWMGVYTSTLGMFPECCFQLPQYYSNQIVSDEDLVTLFKAYKSNGGEAIVFFGFPNYFEKVIKFAKAEGLKIGAGFSGGLSEFAGRPKEDVSLGKVLKFKKEGIIDEVAVMKVGLDLCLSEFLKSKVHRIHPSALPITNTKLDLEKGKVHIGVFGNGTYNKNRHNQVAAALQIENSVVHVVYGNEFEYLDFDNRIVSHSGLSRQDFLNLAGSMDVNLYISYSESWGMVVTESISMGVPCLASNNSGILSYNKALEEQLVVVDYDNPKAIADSIRDVLKNDPKEHYADFIHELNKGSKKLMEEFLASF